MIDSRDAYLGRGLHFPIRVDSLGTVELIGGEKDIFQSIQIILGTRCGERVMRPDFGCRVHDLLFEPRDAVLVSQIQEAVLEALARWEPRIEVIAVEPEISTDSDGAIYVQIDYRIKASHDQRSIVYPFFIEQQEEW